MEKHSERMLSDFNRMLRYYSKREVSAHMVNYVLDRYMPRATAENWGRSPVANLNSNDPERVIEVVIVHYRAKMEDLQKKSRLRQFVYVRHIGMYLLATRTRMTLKAIGEIFGGRDHTSVIHARESVARLIQNNNDFRKEVEYLNSMI